MNPVVKLFELLDHYIQIDEYAKHVGGGEAWWKAIRTDDDAMKNTEAFQKDTAEGLGKAGTKVWGWVRKTKLFCDEWYGALAVCSAYFIGMVLLDSLTNPVKSDDEKQDDSTQLKRRI